MKDAALSLEIQEPTEEQHPAIKADGRRSKIKRHADTDGSAYRQTDGLSEKRRHAWIGKHIGQTAPPPKEPLVHDHAQRIMMSCPAEPPHSAPEARLCKDCRSGHTRAAAPHILSYRPWLKQPILNHAV